MRWTYPLALLVCLACLVVGAVVWAGGLTSEQPVHRTPVVASLR